MFWGEQQAIAAIVAVACNFFVPRVMSDLVALRNGKEECFCLPQLTGRETCFYFLFMILFCLKVLLAIGVGLVITALL